MSEVPLYGIQCVSDEDARWHPHKPDAKGLFESGPLRAVHLSRHKWPGGLVNYDAGRLSESYLIILHGLGEVQRLMSSQE